MSSTISSTLADRSALTLRIEASRPVLTALALWLILLVAAIAAAGLLAWQLKVVLVAGVLAGGLWFLRGQLSGMHPHALRRATLAPDGEWLLSDGHGRQWPAELDPASRCVAGVGFLQWRSSRGRRWALVGVSPANRHALRRLRVRLRFS